MLTGWKRQAQSSVAMKINSMASAFGTINQCQVQNKLKQNIHSGALDVVSSHFSFRELIPSSLSFSTHQNPCALIWPRNALYATSRQLQVLAWSHISVWTLGLRTPTMKVSSASKSENYVQTGSKTFSRCLHATALTKSLTRPKRNIPSPFENKTSSSGSHAPIEIFSLNSTGTAQSFQ